MAKSSTVDDLRAARDKLATDIAQRIAQFETDQGVLVQSVTANPKRVPSASGDTNDWSETVRVRLTL
ncbi:hypothetical protein [Salinisphaera sp. T31B1]|uniref:hypothetical protein n=1 Tax=Salinisphaera sp. T31B1 TaxID=727963 RepID=UPI00333EA15E